MAGNDIKLADLTAKIKVNTAGLTAAAAEAKVITDRVGKEGVAANERLSQSSSDAADVITKSFGKAQTEARKLQDSQLKVASASVAAKKSAVELAAAQHALGEVNKNTSATDADRASALLRVEDAQVKHVRSTVALARAQEDLAQAGKQAEVSVRNVGNESSKAETKVRKLTEASQLGRVGFSGMTTAIITGLPALVPLAALATAGVLGMGAAFGAAGLAAGVLGVVTASAFKDIKANAQAVKTAEKAVANANTIQQRATATMNLAQAQSTLNSSLGVASSAYLRMGDSWAAFKKQNAPQTYTLIGRGLDLVATILPKLQPLFVVAADAAGRLLAPFERAAQNGTIDATIGKLSRIAGPALNSLITIGSNLGKVLANLFIAFAPQGQGFLNFLTTASNRWALWSATVAGSDGFKQFIAYLHQTGPIVLATLGSLFAALKNIVLSMGPLAGSSLKVAGALANIVAALPPGVLTPIIAGLIAINLAMKSIATFQGVGRQLSGIFGDFKTKIADVNKEASKVPGGLGKIGSAFSALAGSISPVGVVLTLAVGALVVWAQDKAKARAETEAFTRSLEADSGALGSNTRATVVANLEKAHALEAAGKLGISTKDLTDAVLGNGDANDRVRAVLSKHEIEQGHLGSSANIVNDVLRTQSKELDNAQAAYGRTQVALGNVADAAARAAIKVTELSDAHKFEAANVAADTTVINIGAIALETWGTAAADAKLKLDGLTATASRLKQVLDLLNGVNIDATQAALNYTQAQVTLTESIKAGGRSFSLTTAAGRTNLGNLLQLASASGAYAEARAKQAGSEEAGRQVMINARGAFLAQAAALGVTRARALELANAYFRIPARVNTAVTLTYSGKRPDQVQREIDNIHGKNIVVSVTTYTKNGPVTKNSLGGTVRGGTPGKDSVPALLMPGEEVLKVSDAREYRRNRVRGYQTSGTLAASVGQPTGGGSTTTITIAPGAIQIDARSTSGKPDVGAIEQAAEAALRRVLAAKRAGRRF